MPEYLDDDGRTHWTRIVYVIELDKEACPDRRSPCKGTRCGRIPVYVGQTGLTAEDRFAQHQAGVHASLVRPEERELARRLRNRGGGGGKRYCVYGGH